MQRGRAALPDKGRNQRTLLCNIPVEEASWLERATVNWRILAERVGFVFQLRHGYRHDLEIHSDP